MRTSPEADSPQSGRAAPLTPADITDEMLLAFANGETSARGQTRRIESLNEYDERTLAAWRSGLAAALSVGPAGPHVVRRNEWTDGSYQEVLSDGSAGPWIAPRRTP